MKAILCVTDFTSSCDNAIDYANELARLLNSRLLLFHNIYNGAASGTRESNSEAYSQHSASGSAATDPQQRLEAVQRRLQYEATDNRITYEILVKHGLARANIAALVQQEQVELVVIGSEETNGLKEVLIGTVAGDIIAAVPCPVLIVPQQASFNPLRKMVFAVDQMGETQHNTAIVLQLARIFEAEILFLHVFPEEKAGANAMAEEEIYRLNSWHGYDKVSLHLVLNEHIEEGISQFTRKQRADMLVMGYHNDAPWRHLFTRDYTQEEAFHTYLPMLFTHTERL
jgi:nucleotide-binding universal stress UspA family protein